MRGIFAMKFLRWFLLLSLLAAPVLHARKPVAKAHGGVYAGAITLEAETGQVLFEDNADVRNPPASMTKLMTFAVLHDRLASGAITLQTPVRITAEDSSMGGTQVFLDPRETFPVEELIYAMMIQSANDAAHALARAAGGSVEAFVELMNAKARELGLTNTVFVSPHGLPPASRRVADGDLSTPRDFAKLCRYLVLKTDVLKYTAVRVRDFGPSRPQGPQTMRNHNNLLGKVGGVDGLKTGYTQSAGYCLSATAQRNGRRLIVVVMGSFGPNHEIDKGRARDLKAIELIERGFANLPVKIAGAPAAPTGTAADPFSPPVPAAATTAADTMPVVRTTSAPAADANSTPPEPAVTFRVIPPPKHP